MSTSTIDEDSAALDDLCDTYCAEFDDISKQGDCDPTKGDQCVDMLIAARDNLGKLKDDLDAQRILPPERLDSAIETMNTLVDELRENLVCYSTHEPGPFAYNNCAELFSGVADAAGDLSVALEKDR